MPKQEILDVLANQKPLEKRKLHITRAGSTTLAQNLTPEYKVNKAQKNAI